MTDFYKIFPAGLRERLQKLELLENGYTELRLRSNAPLILLKGKDEYFLHSSRGLTNVQTEAYRMSVNEIREMMEYISNFSVYAYEDEIRQGFLTLQGGHRVGICGKAVLSEKQIKTIRNISFLNIRLARQKKGCADELLPYLLEKGKLCHTLIVSPPGCGKTTLLRDLIRQLSNGFSLQSFEEQNKQENRNRREQRIYFRGMKIGVVDERSEIAACYHGVPQNDLGIRTDVLDGCTKSTGVELLLRSMSPEVIAMDELGGEADIAVVKKSIYSGCRIVATAHGDDRQEWFLRGGKEARVADIPFERYVFLKADGPPGQIEEICDNTGKTIGLGSGGAIC